MEINRESLEPQNFPIIVRKVIQEFFLRKRGPVIQLNLSENFFTKSTTCTVFELICTH